VAGGSSSGGIFISYRREDSRPYAARLYDALKKKSSCHVFFDIDTIGPAHRFAQEIAQALDRSDACIVLIGPKWESITLPDGRRRLDVPDDFVRREVAAALQRGIPVFPVLVDGARVPAKESLPEEIRALTDWEAIALHDDAWGYGVARLRKALKPVVDRSWWCRIVSNPAVFAAVVPILALGGIATWAMARGTDATACDRSPPSLAPSGPVNLDQETVYSVDVTLDCFDGALGTNGVWTFGTPSPGLVDADESWTFSPSDDTAVWSYPPRSVSPTLDPYDGEGAFVATSTGKPPVGCPRAW
jgi:TIR domain